MQSLNFTNITIDFKAAARNPTWSSRLSCGLGRVDFERKPQRLINNSLRFSKIAACASERNSSGGAESKSPGSGSGSAHGSGPGPGSNQGSFLSRSQTYALLKQQMEVAAKSEDYKEAARLRDSLKTFEDEEPVLRLKRLLKEAIDDQRFEDAARYRDELREIAPHSLLKCSSDATTLGIRIQVRSVYIEGRSQPSKGQYFFAYRIRITNNSDRPVQLLRRHWIITDGNGRTEHVWGIGVIGEQPVILPNTGFEYSSACPLSTASGRMNNRHPDVTANCDGEPCIMGWRSILWGHDLIKHGVKGLLGDGTDLKIIDDWIPGVQNLLKYQPLLQSTLQLKVTDLIDQNGNWRFPPLQFDPTHIRSQALSMLNQIFEDEVPNNHQKRYHKKDEAIQIACDPLQVQQSSCLQIIVDGAFNQRASTLAVAIVAQN